MADSTTTNLSLTKPEPGASVGTWGTKLNENFDEIDAVFSAGGTGTSVGLNVGAGKTLNVDGTLDASGGTLTLASGQIPSAALASDSVTTAKIADGAVTDAKISGPLTQDTTGNAATATKLKTARTIGGVSFDGTANINLPGVNAAGNQSTSGNAATATSLVNSANTFGISSLKWTSSTNVVAPDFEATSDRKVKENFRPLENALGLINQVKIHKYNLKSTGAEGIGVIAQELQEIIPEAVVEGETMSVHYNYLFSVLVQAVQELSKKVENGSTI